MRVVVNTYKTSDNIFFTVLVIDVRAILNKLHKDRIGRNNLFYNLKDTHKNAKLIKSKAEGKGREK
ncbi:hypothetical protein [Polaribacter sp. HL-MS24]|uniref:hypothetical protein n=1 Tax=Polaribacter sp. HL-MS24 TaxID=3077735 RepID=UPI002934EF3E|nr:hypothetical protein [Polaribacter sp. HL-MS24]WOC39646.1 hypothetical protein RRF69_08250 [Polaribacter sp. HL-MS24]